MTGFGILLVVGVVLYVLFSKNGSMACCWGHSHHGVSHREPSWKKPERFARYRRGENVVDLRRWRPARPPESGQIIDLGPEDYRVESERP
ncbi:MAG: hypothetical protein PVG78_06385 [Desulfobacterales bacterium]